MRAPVNSESFHLDDVLPFELPVTEWHVWMAFAAVKLADMRIDADRILRDESGAAAWRDRCEMLDRLQQALSNNTSYDELFRFDGSRWSMRHEQQIKDLYVKIKSDYDSVLEQARHDTLFMIEEYGNVLSIEDFHSILTEWYMVNYIEDVSDMDFSEDNAIYHQFYSIFDDTVKFFDVLWAHAVVRLEFDNQEKVGLNTQRRTLAILESIRRNHATYISSISSSTHRRAWDWDDDHHMAY